MLKYMMDDEQKYGAKNGKLGVCYALTDPPKPLRYEVIVDGKTVALLSEEEVSSARAKFLEMKARTERT